MAYLSPIIPGLNLTYQWSKPTQLQNYGGIVARDGTFLDFLQRSEDYSIFRHLVSIAEMEDLFNDLQANFTVLLPIDAELEKNFPKDTFLNLGKHDASKLVNYNTLPRHINFKELTSSAAMKINTRIRGQIQYSFSKKNAVWLTNGFNGDRRNHIVRPDLITNNCIVHLTNSISIPEMS